jgi:hypothetical protein
MGKITHKSGRLIVHDQVSAFCIFEKNHDQTSQNVLTIKWHFTITRPGIVFDRNKVSERSF